MALFGNLAVSLRQMLITQDDGSIEIMDGAERDQTFVTDGNMRKEIRGPATLTRGAGWQGGALRIVRVAAR